MICVGCEKVEVEGVMPEALDTARPLTDLIEHAPLCASCKRGLALLDNLELGPWRIEVGPVR